MKEDGERWGEQEGEAGGENKENTTYLYANQKDILKKYTKIKNASHGESIKALIFSNSKGRTE